MPHRVFHGTYPVRTYDVEPDGLASMQSLCNYLQDAAGEHATVLGVNIEQLAEEGLTWVLHRLHVQVDRFPAWREVVEVETWPSGQNGLMATREFVMRCGGDVIGRGTSAWLVIDLARRRPIRIPAAIQAIPLADRERPLQDDFPRLPAPGRADHETTFRVRFSDLDVNAHVNNVRYVEWALEGLPPDGLEGYRPTDVEVQFKGETHYGDVVDVVTERDDEDGAVACRHRLVRRADGREVALARSRFTRMR